MIFDASEESYVPTKSLLSVLSGGCTTTVASDELLLTLCGSASMARNLGICTLPVQDSLHTVISFDYLIFLVFLLHGSFLSHPFSSFLSQIEVPHVLHPEPADHHQTMSAFFAQQRCWKPQTML